MGREVRRVPANWEHPRDGSGRYRPLHEPSKDPLDLLADWTAKAREWAAGTHPDYVVGCSFSEWDGPPPDPDDYMPWWPESERTHWQMYESTTEGTPISPVFATPEELARWLADTGASTFADMTASYDQWLAMIRGSGHSFSMVIDGSGLRSGVEFEAEQP